MIAVALGAVFAVALLLTRPGAGVSVPPVASRARARWQVRRARRRARVRWGHFRDIVRDEEPPTAIDLDFWGIVGGPGDRS